MVKVRQGPVPCLLAEETDFEAFAKYFGERQVLFVRGCSQAAKKRQRTGSSKLGLPTLRRIYAAHPGIVRRAFNLESSAGGSLKDEAPEAALKRLLGSSRAPEGSWYASFVVQRSRRALAQFLAEALPAKAPDFLLQRQRRASKEDGGTSLVPPKHSDAAWVFFGSNPRPRPLSGRPEHTDAIAHHGTWHVQLKGEKVWSLKPTAELQRKVRALRGVGNVKVRCKEGDVLCVNTKLWWHSTYIPGNCKFSLSVARDMYLDGTSPGSCDMSNVDGHYALRPISKGAVIFTEDDAPDLELPRSSSANCELRQGMDGKMALISKKAIKAGEWFAISESEEEPEEPKSGRKRKR